MLQAIGGGGVLDRYPGITSSNLRSTLVCHSVWEPYFNDTEFCLAISIKDIALFAIENNGID